MLLHDDEHVPVAHFCDERAFAAGPEDDDPYDVVVVTGLLE
jgi:hypothetical protein